MDTHASSHITRAAARRIVVAAAAAAVLSTTAGCGFVTVRGSRRPAPAPAPAGVPASPATAGVPATRAADPVGRGSGRYSTRQVVEHFRAVTGDGLRREPGTSYWSSLELAGTKGARRYRLWDRYGHFGIDVLRAGEDGRVFAEDDGRSLRPDAHGIYWKPAGGGSWFATRFYGNVVLSWLADRRATDIAYRRLDAVLSSLGRPAAVGRSRLPAGDAPCRGAGITLAAGPEGACRAGDRNLTVVDGGHELALSGYSIRVSAVKDGTAIRASSSGPRLRASGAFVAVRIELTNTATAPLNSPFYEIRLRVGTRSYRQASEATFRLNAGYPFPLAGGGHATQAIAFDVPRSIASRALLHGAIVLPSDPDDDLADTSELGASRLPREAAGATSPAAPANPAAPTNPAAPARPSRRAPPTGRTPRPGPTPAPSVDAPGRWS